MAQTPTETPASLRYLTVQDILWINLQVTKKVNDFDFAKLEEAVFYQYGYGSSKDIISQAERFAGSFATLAPFTAGNSASAFVGAATFLYLNGHDLAVEDRVASGWFAEIARGNGNLRNHVEVSSIRYEDVEAAARAVLDKYAATVEALAAV
ncbi:MAG: hypothetical protein WAO58_01370 [Fimbriimonadaceae bacterium]